MQLFIHGNGEASSGPDDVGHGCRYSTGGSEATDSWQLTRESAVAFWHRVRAERVQAIEVELNEMRGEVFSARRAGELAAEEELASEWRRRLRRLMRRDLGLARELRRVLEEVRITFLASADQQWVNSITINAAATEGRNCVAGRDKWING